MTIAGSVFSQWLYTLHPAMQLPGQLLEDLRLRLVETYREAEKNPSMIDYTAANTLHESFAKMFTFISTIPALRDTRLRRFTDSVERPVVRSGLHCTHPAVAETPKIDLKSTKPIKKRKISAIDTAAITKTATKRRKFTTGLTQKPTESLQMRYNLRPRLIHV